MARREILHLAVGAALVWGVGASWLGWREAAEFSANSVAFVLAFLVHELAHKLAAKRGGYPAEFRLWAWGAALTAASILAPLKIIAPGATIVRGAPSKEDSGRIAFWGPASNLVMGISLLALSSLMPSLRLAVYVNSFLALFNLLPAPLLDGRRVLAWSSRVWAFSVASSAVLLVMSITA